MSTPSAPSVRVAPCGPDQVPQLRQFIEVHWRAGHILACNETLLCWQYNSTRMRHPDFQGPSVLLALEQNRIVGMLGLIPTEINLHHQVVAGAWLSNLLVIPEYRTKGVGLKLMWAAHNLDLGAIFDLGSSTQLQRVLRALQYELLDDLPRWVAVCDHHAMIQLLQDANPDSPNLEIEHWVVGDRPDARVETHGSLDVTIKPLQDHFDEEWDRFWNERIASRQIGTNRDASYMNWRYVDHPMYRYECRLARHPSTGEILGAVVFRIEQIKNRNDKVLRLVEFIGLAESGNVLAQTVIESALAHHVTFADFYCTSARSAAPLQNVGFRLENWHEGQPAIPTRFQPLEGGHFKMTGAFRLSKPFKMQWGPLLPSSDFYVTKSDGDMDRPN